jgi:hypothetical protein
MAAFIDTYRRRWPVRAICRALEFSERTYYARKCRLPSLRSRQDLVVAARIRQVWENNYRVYGAGGSGGSCVEREPWSPVARWSGL